MKNSKSLFVGAALVAAVAAGGVLWAASQGNQNQEAQLSSSVSSPAAPVVQASAKTEEDFVPGAHPGVMVRSVPLQKGTSHGASKSGEPASIYIKPGGQRPAHPARALRGVSERVTTRAGKSAKGGVAASLPPSRLPLEVARKDAKGRVTVDHGHEEGHGSQ